MLADLATTTGEFLARPELRALALILGSIVLAGIVGWFTSSALRRMVRRSKTTVDDRLVEMLNRPIFLSVVLFGLYLAHAQFALGEPYAWLVNGMIKTLALGIWTAAILKISSVVFQGADRLHWLDRRTIPLFENLTKILLLGGAVYAFLSVWQLDVKPWLASAGIVGLALGFAAKDSLGNIFGGLSIIADAPYKVGDFVILDGGERGEVKQIGLRSTRILTRDDVEVTVPNSVIANAKIINESGGRWERSRISISASVAYGSDVEQVREVLERAALATENILQEPAPQVRFEQMGDSALIFRILCWIEAPVLRGRAIDALNTSVYKALNAAQIEIPFPQLDLRVRSVPPPASPVAS